VVIGKPLGDSDPSKMASATAALEGFLKQYSNYAKADQKMAEFDKLMLAGTKAKIDSLRIINHAGIEATSIGEARSKIEVMVLRDVTGVGNAEFKATQELTQLNQARDKGVLVNNEYARSVLKINEALLTANPTDMSLGIHIAKQKADVGLQAKGTLGENIVTSALTRQNEEAVGAIQLEALNAARADGTIKLEGFNHALMEVLKTQKDMNSGEALAALEAQETLLNRNALAASAMSKVYDQFYGGQKFAIQIAAINDAMARNPALMAEGTRAVRDLQIAYLSTQEDALSGFQKGILETQKSMNDFAATASTTVVSAFTDMQDAMVGFFTTGKLSIQSFADDLQKNLVKMAVQQSIMAPMSNFLAGDAQGNGGLFGAGGALSSLFGGTGLSGLLGGAGGGALGSSTGNPMYVSVVSGILGGGGASSILGGGATSTASSSGLFGNSGFFSNLFSGTGGGEGSTSSSILSALSGVGSLFGFATGGDGVVGGQGGTDSQVVSFRATPGELVNVRRPGDAGSDGKPQQVNVSMNIMGVSDVDTFRRSQSQVISTAKTAFQRAALRSGGG
jgi:hypothetical protein